MGSLFFITTKKKHTMSRFNTPTKSEKITNLAGGQAYAQSPELQLISTLFTSFANDQFYKSSNDVFSDLKELIAKCDKKFVAKAAIYARTQFGMRSITHVVASELAKYISGMNWAKSFYENIIYRPDDMMEIMSYHTAHNGKIPNSMKKGIAKAFDKFDRYTLAKYRGEGKGFRLVDVVNMVHPKPTDRNAEAIKDLIGGALKSFDTWETELSNAGQLAKSDDEKTMLKKEVWGRLITEKKLGYFALLRNLRNIIEQAPEYIGVALQTLTDQDLISKSLVLPFRFLTAFDEIQKVQDGKIVRDVLIALSMAIEISLKNVPVFEGDTLVVLDVSGSMEGKPAQIGSLFSAVLIKANNCDFMTFSNHAQYVNVNPMDTAITIANSINFSAGGTNFPSIFQTANKKYDRVIILSDMQGWVGHHTPKQEFDIWRKNTNSNPFVYSFDLQGYGSMQFPEKNVFCLAGFSDKVFDTIKMLETDKNAIINAINDVKL